MNILAAFLPVLLIVGAVFSFFNTGFKYKFLGIVDLVLLFIILSYWGFYYEHRSEIFFYIIIYYVNIVSIYRGIKKFLVGVKKFFKWVRSLFREKQH
jgi:hypothetical protein